MESGRVGTCCPGFVGPGLVGPGRCGWPPVVGGVVRAPALDGAGAGEVEGVVALWHAANAMTADAINIERWLIIWEWGRREEREVGIKESCKVACPVALGELIRDNPLMLGHDVTENWLR